MGRPPPTPVRKGTHPPQAHTQALPEGSRKTRASPVNTQAEGGSGGEEERGSGGRTWGARVPGNKELRTFLGVQGGPRSGTAFHRGSMAPVEVPLSHRTSLTQHKFKERRSKNFQTRIHRSSSPKHKAFVGMEPWVGIWLHAHKVSLLFKKKSHSSSSLGSFGAAAAAERGTGFRGGPTLILPLVLSGPGDLQMEI